VTNPGPDRSQYVLGATGALILDTALSRQVKRTRPLITSATYVTRDLGVHENEKPEIAV